MNGRPEYRCLLSALAFSLLLACGGELSTLSDSAVAEGDAVAGLQARAALNAPDYLPSTLDLSGCWRMLSGAGFGQGNTFSFYEVGHNSFIFASERHNPRTKLVFRGDGRFEELNFDPLKPFFPPEYIHSSGVLSEDGDTLERVFADGNNPHRYRRCELVREAPPGTLPDPSASLSPLPDERPQPAPQIKPLLPSDTSDAPETVLPLQPDAEAQPAPTAQPSATALPPPGTIALRPTPSPARLPLFELITSPEPAPAEDD